MHLAFQSTLAQELLLLTGAPFEIFQEACKDSTAEG